MLNERKLTKPELAKREDIIIDMKKNKHKLVKRYGVDAEKVMYGRATNMAKKQTENMDDKKLNLRKMIEAALQNPKAADLNKDGKLSDYEEKRGAAIEKNLNESTSEHIVKYSKPNDTYQVWLGDEIVTDFATKERADSEAKRLNDLQDGKRVDKAQDISEEKDEMSLRNIGSAELEEMGYEAGEKSAYTHATVVTRLQNRPDKLAYSKGFIQGVKDELGSSLNEDYKPSLRAYDVIDAEGNVVYSGLSRDEAIEKANEKADYKFTATDSLAEDIDLGHQDNEPGMLKAELYHIGSYAMELYKMMDDLEGMGEVDFPAWWQSKITTAKNMISGAKHYLDFEMKEPAIDAVVDRLSDVAPEMEIDEELFTPNEIGDEAIDKESASGAFQENLDQDAKVDALQRLKRGEIDTLPSDEDAKAALMKRILDKLSKEK